MGTVFRDVGHGAEEGAAERQNVLDLFQIPQ
jgi:hypothetical protein